MSDALLRIEDLRVGYQQQTVLRGINMELPKTGIVGLMGPAGVGKSTLLRTIARWSESFPGFWTRGDIWVGNRSLLHDYTREEAQREFCLLVQKARLYNATVLDNAIDAVRGPDLLSEEEKHELAERHLTRLGIWGLYQGLLDQSVLSQTIGRQRILSMARLLASSPKLLIVDEPLRDLRPEDQDMILRLLPIWSEQVCILLVSHDQRVIRSLCSSINLITAGRIVESGPTAAFFDKPKTRLGEVFIRTGNCWPTADELAAEQAKEEDTPVAPPPASKKWPGGFHWTIRGLLGGMQRPGLLGSAEEDIRSLGSLDCKHVVTLTEGPYEHPLFEELGIDVHHFPIDDMKIPTPEKTAEMCNLVNKWINAGEMTVLHCKAGLGRTGTMLACQLVHRGHTAVSAVTSVRTVNPYYIQSTEQLEFINEYDKFLKKRLDDEGIGTNFLAELGGRNALLDTIARLYEALRSDSQLGPFFRRAEANHVIKHLHSFFRQLFTGQRVYRGDRPLNTHHLMVISDQHFDRWLTFVEKGFEDHGLSPEGLGLLRDRLENYRPQLVKTSPRPRKLRGMDMPLRGYLPADTEKDAQCNGCDSTITSETLRHQHPASTMTYCLRCLPARSALP